LVAEVSFSNFGKYAPCHPGLTLAACDPTFPRPHEGGFSLAAMSSMYGLQPSSDMNHIHGVCDPHMNSLSLQEMIDSDIKADFDDVMTSNQLGFTNVDSLDLLNNLDDIDTPFKFDSRYHGVDEVLNHPPQWSQQSSQDISALNSNYFDDSLSSSVMVNPNSVMPVHQQYGGPPSHTPSPVPPSGVQHLTVNTAYNTHHNLQSPSPSPMSPHTYQPQHMAPTTQIHYQYHPGQGQGTAMGKTLKVLPPVSSPMQQVPSPGPLTPNSLNAHRKKPTGAHKDSGLPKPAYSYSCLIALALKNSPNGSMSVSEIYKFMCEHFPYFKTAPNGWKNSVRHNLSLNKCFEKIEKPSANGTNQRKGCLWAMNPEKIQKMDEEVKKWSRKDPQAIKKAMVYPHTLEALERGGMVKDYNANSTNLDSEDEEDPRTPASVSSQGSQGYGSVESDFVDIEGFSSMQDTTSLPELNLVGQCYLFQGNRWC